MAGGKDTYLVIGGSGFVGRHIVQALLARGDTVSVFDIVQRYHDTPFYSGDISEEGSISDALRKSGTTCIIHTASPMHGVKDDALYWRVNVDGTKAVIDAAVACGVAKLVFTSSAGVVFSGADLINIDERAPAPEHALDAYNESKATAEAMVLAANGKGGLLTVALRPAGIFGPGDRQAMTGFAQVYERRQTHFQIGDNTNMFDWTYVGNVAHAHLLAADRLVAPSICYPTPPPPGQPTPEVDSAALEKLAQQQREMVQHPLPPIGGGRRVPTSQARPIGPAITPPPNAAELEAAFRAPVDITNSGRPVWHNRFDPLSENALARAAGRGENPLQVAGQAFFITNGEPLYFWDFPRLVWHKLAQAESSPPKKKGTIRFPRELGMVLATAAEWWGWLSGKEPAFTRFRVSFSCVNRWHNIEKARRVLGYEPVVSLEQGVDRMVEWWLTEHAPQKA